MANNKAALKRIQIAERNRQRNVAVKSAIRTAMKKVLQLGEKDQFNNAVSLIDRAVLKGVVHKNAAARYKSRLAKAVQ